MDRAISDAIENDRPNQYLIHSAEDYFGCIAKYQLLDEAPTVSEVIIHIMIIVIFVIFTHSLTHSFTHSFTHSLTHSLTHS